MNTTIAKVLATFNKYRMGVSPNIDQWEKGGSETLAAKMKPYIGAGVAIPFFMLGFPFKSTNKLQKVIGEVPDYAEELAWDNFRQFAADMAAVHEPGIRLTILSDGFIFNELLGVQDRTVEVYHEVTLSMAHGLRAEVVTLRHFYQGDPLPMARTKLLEQFAPDNITLEERILNDPNTNSLYRGMIHFMEEELAWRQFASKGEMRRAAKKLSREMMVANEAYSELANREFGTGVRLSMHPSTNNGKWSFQMVPGKSRHSPWHAAILVRQDGSRETVHRQDAEAMGAELVSVGGQPYFYAEEGR